MIVTARSLGGGVEGAVYVVEPPLIVDVGETFPHGAAEQDTVQVTPLLLASFATVAVNACVPVASTLVAPGETETVIPSTAMVPEFDTDEFATAVAVNVTVKPEGGTLEGAV